MDPLDVETSTASFDLTLALAETARGLRGGLRYSRDLFDPGTMRRLAERFAGLLAAALAAPERRLSDLPLLADDELEQVLAAPNRTAVPYPRTATVHGLFAAVAAATPDAVALAADGEQVTYGELHRRSGRLASHLRRLGVGPEVPVGLCLERSPALVAGMLGILQAGGHYVPLDPGSPRERLRFLLRDLALPVVVTEERLAASLPAGEAAVVRLDRLKPAQAPEAGAPELPTSLAYVMYTSGSTGRPKGVAVPHRAVVRLVHGAGYARFGAGEVFLHLASPSFDAATLEVWGALLHGARLAVMTERAPSLDRLESALAVHQVTTLWLTAGLFHQVIDERPAVLRPVSQLLAGGDALSLPHVRKALAELPGCILVNGYGPTENTTFTCCHRWSEPGEVGPVVPIGRPISNTRVYLLDRWLRPVPPGIPGEIFAGGDGLARGYAGLAGLTAERFIPDPVGGEPGARLYQTGDLARWLPDGTLEFLGRRDQQVKIRGFRVEPAEIEAALAGHPGVAAVVVVPRDDLPGGRALVAYVVAEERDGRRADLSPDALRTALRERLPEHLVPGFFVLLDALPLTPNGKVDRRALPAPRRGERPHDGAALPRDPVEEVIAQVWAEVLAVPAVGIEDDFFGLGGHSLLATQVVSRLRSALGVELSVRTLFEAPTVAELAGRVAETLREGRQERPPAIEPLPRHRDLPLSFAQERLWFLHQLEPASPAYNIPIALWLSGGLEIPALAAALREIVRRHEVLRTTFPAAGGVAVQLIAAEPALDLPVVDLSGLVADERDRAARGLATREARRPFDLAAGPLVRVVLLRLAGDDHIGLLTCHHIVSDGWSMSVLTRELGALYEAFTGGRPSPLPGLAVQYADYACWQRRWLSGEVLEAQIARWRQRLADSPELLELPTDRPRPAVQSFRGGALPVALPGPLAAEVRLLARREGATLFMVLLAAYAALLSRYSRQEDLVIGSPIANRNQVEIEPLIGFFVNTLALRLRTGGAPGCRELLARAREATLGAFVDSELPFERLVEALQPARALSHAPLFQTLLVWQNLPAGALALSALTLAPFEVERETAKLDLNLSLAEAGSGIAGRIEYSRDLFDATTVARMVAHLTALLAGLAAEPGRPFGELRLLSPAEHQQLVAQWNDTAAQRPAGATLHGLVAAQARRTPEAVAVELGGEALSYGELMRRSGSLAGRLRELGVGPDVRVAVCAERSPERVVALLGVLRAGGAYVPLDPEYPRAHLAFMLDDAQAAVVLAQEHLLDGLPPGGAPVLPLVAAIARAGRESDGAGAAADPDNLACVLYTSGSTGRPKGVMVRHAGMVNRLLWAQETYPVTASDRVLQKASFSFDFSLWECFGPLLVGARVVLARPGGQRDSAYLVELIAERGVTLAHFVPSMLGAFLAEPGLEELSSLRCVLSGGEALTRELEGRFFDRLPATVELRNQYGPTEASINVAHWPCRRGEASEGWRPVPIGRPLANCAVYVAAGGSRPAPAGVPGELLLGGAGLARGYLGRPELTAERFVPDPFGSAPGARLYRSGDRGRLLPDGRLEFLGRLDHQVKVRGFRIEPGEIEWVLSRHPEVREAVVLARGAEAERRLVGYVLAPPDAQPQPQALRSYLAERLPDHMVPQTLVVLERWPLTPGGKLDRAALPASAAPRTEIEVQEVPRAPLEEVLAGIWAEALDVPAEAIGPGDDFFDLGGHSLLATRVVARLRDVLRIELPLRELFEAPTLAALAARVAQAMGAGAPADAPRIRPVARGGVLPLSYAQERLWFLHQLEPDSPAYNVPIAVRLRGRLDRFALARALSAIIRRHESLRTTFAGLDAGPVQVIGPPAAMELPVVDLAGLPAALRDATARRIAAAEARGPFDLTAGPVVRAALLRAADGDHIALLTFHHIATDAWSMGVLVREVAAFYDAFSRGEPASLPELPIQYADFAVWQRQWLEGGEKARQIAYWRQRLAGAPTLLQLPADRPRPAAQTFRGAVETLALPADLARRLAGLSRRAGTTLFMTLLAVFQELLRRYTGQEDLCVGSPIANRARVELEGLIGFFVNTLVLRADLSADPSTLDLLGRVRDMTLEAYAHQDLPFEWLVGELGSERSLSHTPLFQVMLALQNAPAERLRVHDLELAVVGVERGVAKFNLELALSATGDGITGAAEYNRDLFDATTIRRLLRHFDTLLRTAAAAPERRLSELSLLADEEAHQLAVEWNDSRAADPARLGFSQRFTAQAKRAPDAAAAACQGTVLSYRELHRRAGALAGWLRARDIGSGSLVALLADRGLDFLTAVLGVLEAGAAYLPLDPLHPPSRLAQVLERSGARVVLAGDPLLAIAYDALAAMRSGRPPAVHALAPLAARRGSVRQRSVEADPAALAYVIFTSGSTGLPKGAMITRQGMLNHLDAKIGDLQLGSGDVIVQTASQCFDISVWQLLAALVVGGRVEILPDEVSHQPARLLDAAEDAGATVFETVPSLLHLLLEEMESRGSAAPRLRALRWLVPTGEALPPELCRRWLDRHPRVPLVNAYGPTECSDDVTHHRLAEAPPAGSWQVPIGRPVANTRLYVLDRALRPAPLGAAGQLHVGGAGVGRGYLNDSAQAAAAFLPDPFSEEAGARLYATGDLARHQTDGRLCFLGRVDHQVKVRGFRIELGDIESALRRNPAVGEAVVLAAGHGAGADRLVAYVVPASGAVVSPQELRAWLAESLPDYMLPSAFMTLAALPLLPSGKVDRRSLPDAAGATGLGAAPRTVPEELIAAIWSELLGVDRIGVDESFFDLGGHSLLATRVLSRLRRAFGVELPLLSLFKAPTIAGLAGELEQALGRRRGTAPPLVPQPRGREVPLSFAQQRLWLLDQLQPGGTAYNIPSAFVLAGPLDMAALTASLREVVRRHEALRTTFVVRDGEPLQRISAPGCFELPQIDLAAIGAERAIALARELAGRDAVRPFDLARGPLFRGTLVRLGPRRHAMLFSTHHIVSDGVSMEVLIQEVTSLYQAFSQGQPSPLPELPVQYPDFALWQRQWLQGEVLEEHLAYWRERLAGLPSVLELPLDRPRPPVQSHAGAARPFRLDEELSGDLARMSRRQGVTPFMLLLAAFGVLLAKHAGQDDVALGTPMAGRDRVELEGLIGFFVNTLVLRLDLAGDPGFPAALVEVRRSVLDAHAHRDLPFERLVEELQPQRSLQHAPLFQVMMTFEVAPRSPELAGLELLPLEIPAATSPFDLTLTVIQRDVFAGAIRYNTDLFDATTIARLARHLEALLAGVLEDPARRLSELPLLSQAERHHLLQEWNDAAIAPPLAGAAGVLITQQVERASEAVAVVSGEQHLSYRELDRLAGRLAGELVRLGVRPEARVGVLLDRSAALPVALLAVWKAGGAYVPLDPAYPAERLAYMLADSQAVALVTEGDLAAAIPGWTKPVVRLDGRVAALVSPDAAPPAEVPLAALAYVIYTSGSTGRPKGVGVSHGALANFLQAMAVRPGLTAADRLLAVTSPSFDIAALELYLPLLAGARLIVAGREMALDGERLAAGWERFEATVLQATPATWGALVEAGWPGAVPGRALCGGEAMPPHLASALAARADAAWNLYGPTETAVWSAAWRLDGSASGTVPVGRPIANTGIYVLDERLRPVPPGTFGEIAIGGEGVARGYLGRPELTAELFVPDSFGGRPGARLYRTGDRGHAHADGTLELAGRRDHQVKVRGYRIELGEVEAALASHPQVRAAAVIVREDDPGDRRLAAYLALRGPATGPDELRRFLAERLPLFMIPSVFVVLAALPRTPNGKVDRRRLPAPDRSRPELEQAFAAPRNETERRIAGVWQEVLGLERLGIHDSFFDLGGQSLLLARVHARLRQQPGGEQLVLIDLFRHPTVAALAEHMVAATGAATEHERPAAAVEDQIARLQEGRRRQRSGRELRQRAGGAHHE